VALQEALFGNASIARQRAAEALRLSKGRDVQYGAALALTFAGDSTQAQTLADDLAARFPKDTIVWDRYLPTLHAQLALSVNNSSKAIELLRVAAPYELGRPTAGIPLVSLYAAYVRGQAYLAAHQESLAAAEFQKILDHRGLVLYEPIGALAHLQLGRAYALQSEVVKARAAYQDFLTLWKDADPDVPILRQAKADYAKLK
jgi:eukaryotic-like serine/threonine-protein kinase